MTEQQTKPYPTPPSTPDPATKTKFCPFSWTLTQSMPGAYNFVPADCRPDQCALGRLGRCALDALPDVINRASDLIARHLPS